MSLDTTVPGLTSSGPDGSLRSFESLYREVSPRLQSYLRAAEPAEADDLAAEVWLAIAQLLDTFVGDENGFQALVFTIARRRIADHRRRRYRRRTDLVGNEVLADHPDDDHTEEQVLGAFGSRRAIEELAQRLPTAQADVIRLRILNGLSVEQTAICLNRSPGAVRILHHRALKNLRG